ncbi:MAG: hypothetical protein AAGN15_05135 [Cyanobacteria bacterium J06581_3]
MTIVSEQYLDIVTYNRNALNNLRRAVVLGQGQFSLILARVNYQQLQNVLLTELSEHLQIDRVRLDKTTKNLRSAMEQVPLFLEQPPESADQDRVLMVTGLEDVPSEGESPSVLETLLRAANLGRDGLPKRFPYPVVLWVNDTVLQSLNRYAPDLKSFSATPIRFEYPTRSLIKVLREQAADTFSQILDTDKGIVLSHRLPLSSSITEPLAARELTFALRQLEQLPKEHLPLVGEELLADLLFLQGRNLHQQGELIRARGYYEKSLLQWQQTSDEATVDSSSAGSSLTDLDKQAVLQFHLGLWWRSHAHSVEDSVRAYEQARAYFEACLTVFRQQERRDRLARFILALSEVLQKLEDWTALQAIAQESTQLHQHDPPRLARDYGFLAEVSLAKYKRDERQDYLNAAQRYAQQALETSEQVLRSPASTANNSTHRTTHAHSQTALRYHRGCYYYLLAIAQQRLGNPKAAIDQLERALQNINPRYDLSLYRQSLERLWHLYYDHKYYAEAFEIKLEQRRIENLFGLRAFIGASQIQASPTRWQDREDTFYPPKNEPSATKNAASASAADLSAAIKASGRNEDIEALVFRLSQARYPVVVVHGQSGVGKSSLLRAGLVPRLRQLVSEGRTTLPVMLSNYSDWGKQLYHALRPESNRLPGHLESSEAVEATESQYLQTFSPGFLTDTLKQLTTEKYQQVVLILDQFEDFFYEHPQVESRRAAYLFLRDCLNLPYIKVVLSLREDFLHYLLEWDRNADLGIVNNDILSKEIRYYLGSFTPRAAEVLIQQLTRSAGFELESALITALVDDLAADTGEIRPIELQVVGAQLQRENITTLAQYRALGRSPKHRLLKNFLDSVVNDCGPENKSVARSVLYLLSEGETRPLKSLSELQEPLALAHIESGPHQLSLVLDILIGSGLVFEVPEVSGVRYQLVHEYLASLVQEQQQPGLIEALQAERSRRQLTEDQLQKALAAQSESLVQATLARQEAKTAEIKALISLSQSLHLAGDGLDALTKALRAARQVHSSEDTLLKMRTALCLATAVRSIHVRNELPGHRNWVLAVDCLSGGIEGLAEQTHQGCVQIASASEDDTVKLWSGYGELLQTLSGHQAGVVDVRFSPDGEYLASASLDHTIRLWRLTKNSQGEVTSASYARSLETANASVTSISFSPTEPLLAATYSDTAIRLWSFEGELLRTIEGHEDWVRTVAFSPDGTLLVTGGEDNTVRLWSVKGDLLDTLCGHRGWVRSVSFSPDGRLIISAGDANALRLWSVEGYKLNTFYGHEDWVRCVAFSPDGQAIASASDDQTIRIWDLDGNTIRLFNHRSSVHSVAWSADGQTLVSGGDDDQVHIWRLDSPPVPIATGHRGIVWSARWQPGPEHKLLSAGGDAALKLWSESGELLNSIDDAHQRGVHSVYWRPDGEFFASASADYSIKLWRANGEFVRSLLGHGDAVWQVRYSPDGQQLASVSSDKTLRLWSHEGDLLKTWGDHTDTVWHVSYSPDGEYLISASEDNTLRLWHRETGLLQTLENNTGGVWCAAFGPREQFVASGGADGMVRLWSVRWDGAMSLEPDPILLRGHRDWVRSLCFSPNGAFLASASDDGTVRLWSLSASDLSAAANSSESVATSPEGKSAQLLPPLLGHEGVVWEIDFDETGERLVSASADGTVRVWDLQLSRLMTQGCEWLSDWLRSRPELRKQLCERRAKERTLDAIASPNEGADYHSYKQK